MKTLNSYKKHCLALVACILVISVAGCSVNQAQSQVPGYPIDTNVQTTLQKTVVPGPVASGSNAALSAVAEFDKYGYGKWTSGPGLPSDTRTDLMPAGYTATSVTGKAKLLKFFTISDIHITDKESPSQLIYLQQLNYPDLLPPPLNALGHVPWEWQTSVYSPIMPYTTHVLDAAIQTVNALHKQNPIDFGLSLGDTCNSTQYNELRWYIDVIDGKVINPSSGAHLGAGTIEYQKPFKAAGLDKSIPWYQAMGNHDHFWIGSLVVNDFLRKSYISDTIIAAGDVLLDPTNISKPEYYMGVLDGSTPNGDIKGAGPVSKFSSAPKVTPDPDRRSLLRTDWIKEFSTTTSNPAGHGFNLVDPKQEKGFACYSFVPKSNVPVKVIVLDDTQSETDGDASIHGHGYLDQARWDWLKKELADGDAAGQLMIIAAHVPIGVQPDGSFMEWWNSPQNAVNIKGLLAELHSHPNLIMWIAGHRHLNTVKAFLTDDPSKPERGFWQVETSSLRDFPQQFRTFEIFVNSDYTISVVTTDVDPAVKDGTPAAISRKYAVAVNQIAKNNLSPNLPGSDPTSVGYPTSPDPTIKPMPTYSYNATLLKQLGPAMKSKMQTLFP